MVYKNQTCKKMIDWQAKINKYDRHDFRKSILTLPEQLVSGVDVGQKDRELDTLLREVSFQRIIVSGMGGSALVGAISDMYLANLTNEEKNDILAVRENHFYNLPTESYQNSLNIFCSYSGNTEETISAFQEALRGNLPSLAISSGGLLEKLARENKIPFLRAPKPFDDFQPRIAVGYPVSLLMTVLQRSGKFLKATSHLEEASKSLKEKLQYLEGEGRKLALELKNKTILIYAPAKYENLARIWKISFNENSKSPAFWNYLPELNHNEMSGFANKQGDYAVVMLYDQQDDKRNQKRFDLTAKVLEKRGLEIKMLKMREGNPLERIFLSLALANWTSYYLALLYQTDPAEVKLVEEFKKLL